MYTDLRVASYARMSQDISGEMLGLQRQVDECTALAEQNRWEIARRFDDNDLSAFSGKTRPGFEALLESMKRGEIDVLLCWHVDRLYRSMKDLERLIDIAEKHRVHIKAVQGGELDLSSSAGRMVARILGSVSRQESEHKGERQRLANEQRRTSGVWSKEGIRPGQRPFGYTKEGKPLEPEASLLKKAATDVLGKASLRSIAIAWNKMGVTTTRGGAWTNLQLRRLLSNPLYAGLVTHGGEVVGRAAPVEDGGWEPLLEEGIHLGLVAFLKDPVRKRDSTFEVKHQGSGVYRCGVCGGRMYAGYPHRGAGKPNKMTYRCRPGMDGSSEQRRAAHVARIGEPLDLFVSDLVIDRLITKLEGDAGRLASDTEREDDGVDVVMVTAQLTALRERLDGMAVQCALGEIDNQQLASATAALKPKMAEYQAVLDASKVAEVETEPEDEIIKDGPEKVAANWAKASPAMRGKVIDRMMTVTVNKVPRGTRVFDDKYIDVQWKRRGV